MKIKNYYHTSSSSGLVRSRVSFGRIPLNISSPVCLLTENLEFWFLSGIYGKIHFPVISVIIYDFMTAYLTASLFLNHFRVQARITYCFILMSCISVVVILLLYFLFVFDLFDFIDGPNVLSYIHRHF